MLSHFLKLCLQAMYLLADESAVSFQLRFTRAPGANAPAELFQMTPLSSQARKEIMVLSQFYLQAAIMCFGAFGEDIQD